MKQLYLISLFTIVCISGFSQFKEGYIVYNGNDTIFGYINFEGSLLNSDHCVFQVQLNSDAQIYKPADIKAFRFIHSKYFVSREILVNNKPQKVFLEWLIEGRASILTYTQSVSVVRYFLLLEDDSLIELTNTSHVSDVDNKHYIHDNKEYIGLLKFYFRDCPSLQPRIETVFFDSKSLIKITKDYHDRTCKTGDCIIYEDRNRKVKIEFGISAGFLSSNLKLNNSIPEKVYPSNSIEYGLALNISNLPLLSSKFSSRLNIMFQNSLYKYDTTDLSLVIKDDKICKIDYIRIPLQLNYNFSHKKLNPYISLGINLNFRLAYKKYDQYLINHIKKDYPFKEDRGIYSFQYGLNSGLGLNYVISPRLGISFGYHFEYSPRFFGNYVNDYTYNLNNSIQLIIYYKNKK
ncbi:MAG: hypothetical protein LLG13_00810 [Bacteroidales bacterium]|nr:hypothetical protein [Bacteroidales bacterium]